MQLPSPKSGLNPPSEVACNEIRRFSLCGSVRDGAHSRDISDESFFSLSPVEARVERFRKDERRLIGNMKADDREPSAGYPILVRRFHLPLQGAKEICAARGADKFVIFDHGSGSDPRRGQRRFHPDHARGKAHPNCIGQRNMGWEGQSDFAGRSRRKRPVEVKKNSARAHVLSFSF
jgi:hypothetical protein